MPCYHPLSAYQRTDGAVVFAERGDIVRSLNLACGQCIGCRLERSRQWAVRCMHEASLHDENCFLTLTYDDAHLSGPSLDYSDFQRFLKRVRRWFAPARVRFFCAGQYGGRLGRPHFHCLLFGVNFADRLFWMKSPAGHMLFRSKILESLWPLGYSSIGEVTRDSAGYVARYLLPKVTGRAARAHYTVPDTGEIRVPEFCHMSLKPGIGEGWIRKWKGDVSRDGLIVVDGVEQKVPRYYEQFFGSDLLDSMEQARYVHSVKTASDNTDRRLVDREVVRRAAVRQLKRGKI